MKTTVKRKQEIWPWMIVLSFVAFIGFIVLQATRMFGTEINLVSEDYYAREVMHQEQINKEILTETLRKELAVRLDRESGRLTLVYPLDTADKKLVQGNIHLFRPSSYRLDRTFEVKPGLQGKQILDIRELETGYWLLKVNWKEGGLDFYHEEPLMF